MKKIRLDLLLVERGLAESRSLAQRLVMAGRIRVNGQVELRSSTPVSLDAQLVVEQGSRFVSRGGEKLEKALQEFSVAVSGSVCADVGSSTGGFTDCLLQHGAAKVYAIDVGQGLLDWRLRQDERVVIMEGTNARYLDRLPEPVDVVTIDVSFISLKVFLPVITGWFAVGEHQGHGWRGTLIALIKPQFEAGRQQAGHGKGVIRDPEIHRQVMQEVLEFACQSGYGVRGLIRSPLIGPKGNVEFLVWLEFPGASASTPQQWIDTVLPG